MWPLCTTAAAVQALPPCAAAQCMYRLCGLPTARKRHTHNPAQLPSCPAAQPPTMSIAKPAQLPLNPYEVPLLPWGSHTMSQACRW